MKTQKLLKADPISFSHIGENIIEYEEVGFSIGGSLINGEETTPEDIPTIKMAIAPVVVVVSKDSLTNASNKLF